MTAIRSLVRQGMRFGLVGIASTLTYLAAASAAHLAGAQPALANVTGYCVATGISFLGHFHWTFEKRNGQFGHLLRFLVLTGCGFLLSDAIMLFVVQHLQASFWTGLLAIVLLVPPLTWMGGRYWAFK